MPEYQLPKAYLKKRKAEHAAVLRMQRYDRLKREWITEHPGATREEYQSAMNELARRCSV